jgi:hypothetical protein
MISNFIFSAILVLHFWYLDYRTVTTLLTNTMLVAGKISKSLAVSKESFQNGIATSNYSTKFIRFNRVDRKYRDKLDIANKMLEEIREPEPIVIEEVEMKDLPTDKEAGQDVGESKKTE